MKTGIFTAFVLICASFLVGKAAGEGISAVSKPRVNQLTSELLLDKASRAFEEKNTEKAIRLFRASIKYNTRYAEAYYRLGVVYAYIRNFKEAVSCFRKAIKFRPDFPKAYLNLGSTYGQLKNYKQALFFYQKALALEENDPVIYYNIGALYSAMGKQELAQEYFAKAKELTP
jgi:Flp pilus assembly protein TadD